MTGISGMADAVLRSSKRIVRSRATALAGASALLLGLVAVTSTAVIAPASAAPISDLSLSFVSGVNGTIAKGAPIDASTLNYQFIIQYESTGVASDSAKNCLPPSPKSTGTDPAYPNNCQWPSSRTSNTGDPIVASGNQDDINNGNVHLGVLQQFCADQATKAPRTANSPVQPCKFLISIKADGYEIGGAHFSVPATGPAQLASAPVVSLLQYPLPLANIRVRIFQDTVPADGVYEIDAENGLAGFHAYLNDMLGDLSTDYFGNPLCTQYLHDDAGQVRIDADGSPVIDTVNSTGQCVSDRNGDILIPNMAPGRYGIVIRAPKDKLNWLQTTTLEGAQDHDWWVMAGDTGYGTETTAGGELVPEVQFGFVPPEKSVDAPWTGFNTTTNADIFYPQFPANATNAYRRQIRNLYNSARNAIGGHTLTGGVHEGCTYIASVGGAYVPNSVPGANGTKDCGPIKSPYVAVSGLDVGDQVVWAGTGNPDGTYKIPGLADGNYMVTVWDAPINHILETFNVTIKGGDVNAGIAYVGGWFTHITGSVFVDTNGNGRRDPGEQGVERTNLTFRERDNTPFDQFTNSINTDANGNYDIIQSYPLSRFTILEHSDLRYKATGYTVQACNEKTPTTYLGGAVDVSVLPVIGLCGKVDWAVQPYKTGETGGIVGTVTYGTTRNELDPANAATESWQPGIAGVPVNLYAVVRDSAGNPVKNADGSLKHGPQLADTYTSENYKRPQGCKSYDRTGAPLTGEQVLADPAANTDCIEAPLAGFLAKPSDATPGASAQDVTGNYGFSTSRLNLYDPASTPTCTTAQLATITATGEYPLTHCVPTDDAGQPLALYAPLDGSRIKELGATGQGADPSATNQSYSWPEEILAADEYLVSIQIPTDAFGKPAYKPTKEEDVNIFSGDDMAPQEGIEGGSGASAGPDCGVTGKPACSGTKVGLGVQAECAGPNHLVHVTNADFQAAGGSPYEGEQRPLCTDKLVDVVNATQQATNFELFTDVPVATHFWGLILNDLGVGSDPTKIQYGEVEGLPNAPTGIYDWAGNLVDTAVADPNGFYEAIEPSTTRINNPSPTGVSPGVYRFVGNDPGVAGHLNPTYDSRYRTIATDFQAWPGLWTVTDTAPTLTAAQTFNGQMTAVKCTVSDNEPQVFHVDKPVASGATTVTIDGRDFGASQGSVLMGAPNQPAGDPSAAGVDVNSATPLTVLSWNDTQIKVLVPAAGNGFAAGPRQLFVRGANGKVSTTGITEHVIGSGYSPTTYEVGPGRTYSTIQAALEAAAGQPTSVQTLVVVYPGTPSNDLNQPNPNGAYFENIVIHSGVKVQGTGPGGFLADGSYVQGSVIDGSLFQEGATSGNNWLNLVSGLNYQHSDIPLADSAAVTVVTPVGGTGQSRPAIDGFTITGGIQQTTPTNINVLTGGTKTPYGGTGAVVTQGGGIYVHGGSTNLTVSNNKIDGNSGSYAGAIRIGTPYANGRWGVADGLNGPVLSDTAPANALTDTGLVIAHNSITNNGGANLGGAVGLFSGTRGYRVAYNDVCGNFSAEYGGGISHYGYSPGSRIDHNRVWFNESYDEGGAILVAGEVPPTPDVVSGGAGDVKVDNNRIDQNLSNDDGGGIRLLNAGVRPISIENNEIVNNVSAHEGGGIALNDATNVTIDNNTVARNVTTATAVTSNGLPAAAGLATSGQSAALLALANNTPGAVRSLYTNPTAFNNIFWDNRAGSFTDGQHIVGIADTDKNVWDIGSPDTTGNVTTNNSIVTSTTQTAGTTTLVNPTATAASFFTLPLTLSVHADARRSFVAFRQTVITDMTVSPWNVSNYGLKSTAAAVNLAPNSAAAPVVDLTGFPRQSADGRIDAGALELFANGLFHVPAAPVATSVTQSGTALTLNWTAPADLGNPAATGYIVRIWDAATGGNYVSGCTVAAPATSCTTSGLPAGRLYADVVAYNAVGVSPASARLTPPVPPAPPTNVQVSASATLPRALVVSWTAPATTPAAIASYTAQAYTNTGAGTAIPGATCTTAGLTCTITTNLANGTTYRISVVSATAAPVLTSAPTAFVSGTTTSAPGDVVLTATGGHNGALPSVRVNWTAPTTGGLPITSYTVTTYRCTGFIVGTTCIGTFSATTAGGTALPTFTLNAPGAGPYGHTFTGAPLAMNTRYWFWVTATNAAGTSTAPVLGLSLTGRPSVSAVPSITGPVVTLAPRSAAKGTLTVAWTKATTPAAAAAARWTVRVFPSATSNKVLTSCISTGAAARCSVRGLVSGHTYYVSVVPTGAPWPVVKAALRVKGIAR